MSSKPTARGPKHKPDTQSKGTENPKPPAKVPRSVPAASVQNTSQFDPKSASSTSYTASKPPITLSLLVQNFLVPESGEYKACELYCRPNPGIWTHDDINKLPGLAKECLRQNKAEHGRRLVERWLMVATAKQRNYTAAQAIEFLKTLEKNGKARDSFESDLQNAITKLSPAAGDDDDDDDDDDDEEEDDNDIATAKVRGPIKPDKDKTVRQQPARRSSIATSESLSPKLGRLNLSEQASNPGNSPGQIQQSQTRARQSMSSQTGGRDAYSSVPFTKPVNTVEVNTLGNGSKQIEAGTDQVGPNPDYLQTYEGKDELNASYILREDQEAIDFFVKGRVFAMVWHENAGKSVNSNSSKTTAALDKPFHTKTITRDGVQVFSHIRRFVIVKARYGYCWAIPINSYGGRGVTKKGMSSQEQQAHTIVYSRGYKAQYIKDEVRLDKKSIAVDMARGQKPLTTASRLHFDKPQSIDWNIKVSDVGMIKGPDDIRRLINYFNEEFKRGDG